VVSTVKRRRIGLTKALGSNVFLLVVLVPLGLHFLVFEIAPLLFSLVVSFLHWPLGGSPRSAGMANWTNLFKDILVAKSLLVTIKFAAYYLLPAMCAGLILALLVGTNLRGTRFFKSLYFLPVVTSIIILAGVWKWLFLGDQSGMVNFLLTRVPGIPSLQFFSREEPALIVTVLLSIYKAAGYLMVYFLAGLNGIPEEIYEAARIDGAGGWPAFWKITLPLLRPTILYVLIVSTIDVLQVFESSFVLTAGGPNYATTTIVFLIYRTAFANMNLGYASSIAYILFAVILFVTLVQYRILNREVDYA
jgi:multiple sugar transport system permease protein